MLQKSFLTFLILSLALFSACASTIGADEEPLAPGPKVPPDEALKLAGDLYRERADIAKVREAIKVLGAARNLEDRDFEVEHTFAKYSYFLGSRESIGEPEVVEVLKEGLVAARIAKRLEPEKPDGYFWEAAIRGEQSKRSPITVGIPSIDNIREGMQKVIEIDPGYQGASAYLGLGQLELNTRGLAGGKAEKAVEYLENGMSIEKNNAYLYLYLADAYFALRRDQDAVKIINDLRKMEPDPDYVPEYEEALAKAEKMLKEKMT